jgi:hypothetical protein
MGLVWCSLWTAIISLNSVNQMIFVMVKCSVFFAVRTEFLNIIQTSFGFKGFNKVEKLQKKQAHTIVMSLKCVASKS